MMTREMNETVQVEGIKLMKMKVSKALIRKWCMTNMPLSYSWVLLLVIKIHYCACHVSFNSADE